MRVERNYRRDSMTTLVTMRGLLIPDRAFGAEVRCPRGNRAVSRHLRPPEDFIAGRGRIVPLLAPAFVEPARLVSLPIRIHESRSFRNLCCILASLVAFACASQAAAFSQGSEPFIAMIPPA